MSQGELSKSTQAILKLDIEGSEWKALLACNNLSKFAVMVIEFHWLEETTSASVLATVSEVFKNILLDFDLVHVHGNNFARNIEIHDTFLPSVFEATFLNKKFTSETVSAPGNQIKPDSPNNPNLPELKLSDFWFSEHE